VLSEVDIHYKGQEREKKMDEFAEAMTELTELVGMFVKDKEEERKAMEVMTYKITDMERTLRGMVNKEIGEQTLKEVEMCAFAALCSLERCKRYEVEETQYC